MLYRLLLFLIYFYAPYLNITTIWKKTALEYDQLPRRIADKLGKVHWQRP